MCEKARIATDNICQQEPGIGGFSKRIGSTMFNVTVHFDNDSNKTIDDKIMRLIKNDLENQPQTKWLPERSSI